MQKSVHKQKEKNITNFLCGLMQGNSQTIRCRKKKGEKEGGGKYRINRFIMISVKCSITWSGGMGGKEERHK